MRVASFVSSRPQWMTTAAVVCVAAATPWAGAADLPPPVGDELFAAASSCQACHNSLGMEGGADLSIGVAWRATPMANSAVDPYWRAGVRREIIDHPQASAAIQDECAKCHMPMQRFANAHHGQPGKVFADAGASTTWPTPLPVTHPQGEWAQDGVSCSVCHQIQADGLGTEQSYVGGFAIETRPTADARQIFGPHAIDAETAQVMRSASGFLPAQGVHQQSAELCATCHTLYTHSLDADGNDLGRFPEQMPYLEWKQSDYADGGATPMTCQRCHMATTVRQQPISSVLGKARAGFSMHSFRGGNFVLQQLLGAFGADLEAQASPSELALGHLRTIEHLQTRAASVHFVQAACSLQGDALVATVKVENHAGHKLPTAYPSRRAWIELRVQDARGKDVFVSGALAERGAIAHNDNDADSRSYEPHYQSISSEEQVQIYEPVLGDPNGAVTTGLLTATQYLKDNRLLPRGFDKTGAPHDVAVHGEASKDADFAGGEDRIVYRVSVTGHTGPFRVTARLWYQPIGFRWANNLARYDAPEPQAFGRMFATLAERDTAVVLAEAVWVPGGRES